MKQNLTARTVVIVATILICIFGIIGLPKSVADLKSNFEHNISLGLDLKGGSYLVLEVQVQDAVKADAQQTSDRLSAELKKENIAFTSSEVNDAQTVADADNVAITLKGVPATQSSAFKNLVTTNYTTYIATALNPTDYQLKMKPTDLQALKSETVKREIDTITNRIDQMGLSEPSVQQYGRSGADYEILVQLPGVDDPAHVREQIGTTAVLEIDDVKGGPYPSKEAAMAEHGGILPLNTKIIKAKGRAGQQGDEWYLAAKSPVIMGQEMRNARPSQGEMGRWETDFNLSQDAGKRFGRYTEANINNRLAVVMDNVAVSVATIQAKIEDSGRITNLNSEEEAEDLSRYLRSGALPASIRYNEDRTVGPSSGSRFDSRRNRRGHRRADRGNLCDAGVLQTLGGKRSPGADPERCHFAGGNIVFPCDADSAGNRGCDSDHWYGGRFQRPDLRAHSRGTAHR